MKRNKIAATMAIVVASALALSGCSASNSSDEAQTITYWTWFPPEATLEAAVAAFENENPNINVELRTFEGPDYQKQLPLALSGGEEIDVAGVQISAMTNTVKDYLLPVKDWAGDWLGNINTTMIDQSKAIATDGELYAVPMGSIGSPIMYYNAEMLNNLGIEVPTTGAEWKAAVEKISASDPGITPVVFSGDGWWQEEMLFGIAEQKSPGLSDDIIGGDGSWDQKGLVDGLKAYKSLFDDGIVGSDVLSLAGSRANEIFVAGDAAFYIDGSWNNSLLSESYRKDNSIGLTDVGAAPLPVIDGGSPSVRALAEGGLAIPAASKHVEAATKFIEFMVSTAGANVWAKDLVLVPSLNGYELPDGILTSAAAKEGFASASKVIGSPTSKRDSQQDFLNQVEGNTILDVLRGTVTPEQAAATLQSEWNSGRYPHGSSK